MYQWALDAPAAQELAALDHAIRKTLAEFMDAVVLVDPAEYQRRPDEPANPDTLRTLPFGKNYQGFVTFLIYPPDDLVLVVRIQWLGE